MLVPWNPGRVVMVLTEIEPMSHAPMDTLCILHNLSMSIPTATLDMRQSIGCGARHKPPGLVKPRPMLTQVSPETPVWHHFLSFPTVCSARQMVVRITLCPCLEGREDPENQPDNVALPDNLNFDEDAVTVGAIFLAFVTFIWGSQRKCSVGTFSFS